MAARNGCCALSRPRLSREFRARCWQRGGVSRTAISLHVSWIACTVAHRVNDNLVASVFIKDQIWIRSCVDPPDAVFVGQPADLGMTLQQFRDHLDALCHLFGRRRRFSRDVIEYPLKIGKCRKGVAQSHAPCFAQTAATFFSEANSPRRAAARDLSMATRSSAVSRTGATAPAPTSSKIARAISSWSSLESFRAASNACSSSLVMSHPRICGDNISLPRVLRQYHASSIDVFLRVMKSCSASSMPGSSGGASYSASIVFQRLLARVAASTEPAACHFS